MATGGHDKSYDSLDLSEINAELENLDRSSESETTDSLVWENSKAELAYECIEKETNKHDFLGFEQLTSTPIKSAHSTTAPTTPTRSKSRENPKGTKSAPVSPVLFRAPARVQQRIESWEKLIDIKSQVHLELGQDQKSKLAQKGELALVEQQKRDLLVH